MAAVAKRQHQPVPTIQRESIAVLVPAHNEQDQLAATLASLAGQSRPPDQVIVISDNSTDATVEIARAAGVVVVETVGNNFKKAGALNVGLQHLLEQDRFPEFIVTIDADTVLASNFIGCAVHAMEAEPDLGGLSAVCQGKAGLGATFAQKILAWWQRAEYVRAGFVRIRRNIHTMSGAGSMFRAEAVLQVVADRGVLYKEDPANLVEDFEATLEIKRHGWRCTNNFHTVAHTDLMVTWPALLKQRIRWVGGTIDEVRRRGWTKETRATIITLLYGFVGIPVFYLWLVLLGFNLANGINWGNLWFLVFVGLYQAITLQRLGWRSMVLGFLLAPELPYMFLRHFWIVRSLIHSYASKHRQWE